uniref:Uncharacterized protein n=1 Tax=Timema tahoe TaxID=61484 RepID=A0A7R9IR90_9NEOP|nr:unnamed protein product [Timema tahoe]
MSALKSPKVPNTGSTSVKFSTAVMEAESQREVGCMWTIGKNEVIMKEAKMLVAVQSVLSLESKQIKYQCNVIYLNVGKVNLASEQYECLNDLTSDSTISLRRKETSFAVYSCDIPEAYLIIYHRGAEHSSEIIAPQSQDLTVL